MKRTTAIEKEELRVNALDRQAVTEGTAQAAIIVLMLLAALVGVWGLACLVGGVVESGAGGLLRGFIAAVTGR